MPSRKVEVTEYECAKCLHKWINRINAPKPRSAKCKRWDWEEGYLSPIQKQLRRDLLKIEEVKEKYSTFFGYTAFLSISTDICTTFLSIWPRPTEQELRIVLNPICYLGPYDHGRRPAYSHRGLCSDQIECCPGWIPMPDNPGSLARSYDFDRKICEGMKIKEKDARHQLMQHIIDSRNRFMHTNSTHYRYFKDRKERAKLLSSNTSEELPVIDGDKYLTG
jgi:hypothetical protein